MSAKVPDVGVLEFLNELITASLNGAKCHLYSNNYLPVAGSLLSNFTEATFTGYSAQTLGSWSTPVINGSDQGTSTAASASFTPTSSGGSGNLYGYYVTDSGGTKLLFAELFAGGPITVPQSVTLSVTCTFLDSSLF